MKEHNWLNPATCLQYHAFSWIFLMKPKRPYTLLMILMQRYNWMTPLHDKVICLKHVSHDWVGRVQLFVWMFSTYSERGVHAHCCLSFWCRFLMVQLVITFLVLSTGIGMAHNCSCYWITDNVKLYGSFLRTNLCVGNLSVAHVKHQNVRAIEVICQTS